ncbi:Carboxypeptidase inhibitor SmCI [Holothuria leucospilota]|uniref:Carboxypeptidase inhibitor SmCI n=1 Tax=Holothuria leucospilota TaxID=206669 RepID=A0A9Q1CMN6_HOLLE|nr:Carboxypeptidase inhibitor SmCI [Holothuria leucospilota]
MVKFIYCLLLTMSLFGLIAECRRYGTPRCNFELCDVVFLNLACYLPLETGPCKAVKLRFGFKDGQCQQFIYGGCKGNRNNFRTIEDCIDTCGEEDSTDSWLD